MASQGVIYVTYGEGARREARMSAQTLATYHRRWPVAVIGDQPVDWAEYIEWPDTGAPGRWAKVNLDRLSPFDPTLFLDADTRVYHKLDVGFNILANGWDMVMCGSIPQGGDVLRHCSDEERDHTLAEIHTDPYQLNTGVIFFRKSVAVKRMFAQWRREWKRWKDKDQGALLRALHQRPVAIFLLGRSWNGGAVIGHRFGACGG
jgi:hypothetical protein